MAICYQNIGNIDEITNNILILQYATTMVTKNIRRYEFFLSN